MKESKNPKKLLLNFFKKFANTKLFLTFKNPLNFFIFFVSFLFLNYLVFKFEFSTINYNRIETYLFFILLFLMSINLVCLKENIKEIIKKKRKTSVFSILLSLFLLPFSQLCIAGICSYGFILALSSFLPIFLTKFFIDYLVFLLIIAIILNILSLKNLKCFSNTTKNNEIFFSTKRINF
jgi:hypothetical protein